MSRPYYDAKYYRTNLRKQEPYYSCRGCGERFHDSNPLLVHIRECRLYKIGREMEVRE